MAKRAKPARRRNTPKNPSTPEDKSRADNPGVEAKKKGTRKPRKPADRKDDKSPAKNARDAETRGQKRPAEEATDLLSPEVKATRVGSRRVARGKATRSAKSDLPRPKISEEADEEASSVEDGENSSNALGERGTIDIPKDLMTTVSEISAGVFLFVYPLEEIGGFRRLEWAVSDKAVVVAAAVAYRKGREGPSFGVNTHLDPEADHDPDTICFSWTNKAWTDESQCTQDDNFLTYVLGRQLHSFLSDDDVSTTLRSIHGFISDVLEADPGAKCIVCHKKLRTKLWRPTPCSPECTEALQGWPLNVRLSPLVLDTLVLDFLLCCVKSALNVTVSPEEEIEEMLEEGVHVRPGHPALASLSGLDVEGLDKVLDSFPAIKAGRVGSKPASAEKLVGVGGYASQRREVLSWLCNRFRGSLITAPTAARVTFGGRQSHQFFLNSADEAPYAAFARQRISSGSVAFHGTPSYCLLNILADKLRTPPITVGDTLGVFYASEPSTSLDYLRNTSLSHWTHSNFEGSCAMFGLELIGDQKPDAGYGAEAYTPRESDLTIRYVFVFEQGLGANWPGYSNYRGLPRPTMLCPLRESISQCMTDSYRRHHSAETEAKGKEALLDEKRRKASRKWYDGSTRGGAAPRPATTEQKPLC